MTRADVPEGAADSRVADIVPNSNEAPTSPPVREYKCEHCSKTFKSMIRLRNHRRTHPVSFDNIQDNFSFMINDVTSGRDTLPSLANEISKPEQVNSPSQTENNTTFTVDHDMSHCSVVAQALIETTNNKARRRSALPLASAGTSFQRNATSRLSLRMKNNTTYMYMNETYTLQEDKASALPLRPQNTNTQGSRKSEHQIRDNEVTSTNTHAQRRLSGLSQTLTRDQRRLSSLQQTPTRNERRLSLAIQTKKSEKPRWSNVFRNKNSSNETESIVLSSRRSTLITKSVTPQNNGTSSKNVRTPRKDGSSHSRHVASVKSRTPISSRCTQKTKSATPKTNKTPKRSKSANKSTPKSNKTPKIRDTPVSSKGTPLSAKKSNTPGGMKFKCHRCGKGFLTRRLLDIHFVIHVRDSPKSCGIPHNTIKHRPRRLQLLQQMTPLSPSMESRIYKCDTCGRVYQRERYLLAHKKTHTINKPHACDICKKNFKYLSSLKSHKIVHIGEKSHNDVLKSIELGQIVSNRRSSVAYEDEVNDLNLNATVKDLFSLTEGDSKQNAILDEVDDCQFTCKSCDFKTIEPMALLKHMRSHSARRPYVCTKCNKSYAKKSNLDVHEKIHVIDRLRLVLKTRSKSSA